MTPRFETLLVAVDLSACAVSAVRVAAALGRGLGARLVIFHVAQLPAGVAAGSPVRIRGEQIPAATWVEDDARRHLATLVALAESSGVRAEPMVGRGPVVDGILAAIEATAADLLVIGTHGRDALGRALLGSVADEVARRADIPVTRVKRDPDDRSLEP